MAEWLSTAGRGPLLIEELMMRMNPYESGAAERGARSDPELIARVQAIETVLPTLATRAQLEQLRGEMKEGFGTARAELKEEVGAVRAELKEEVGAVRAELKAEVGAVRAEMREGFGLLRAEMKEGFGSLRAEMHQMHGGLRAEMHQMHGDLRADLHKMHGNLRDDLRGEVHRAVVSSIRWSIGLAVSIAMLAATLIAAVAPFVTSQLHG